MHIKICGITNLDDALAAIDAGATHLGFNFYPKSPRYITPETCARLQSQISTQSVQSRVTTVGIFVNESPSTIAAILDHCGLDLAQLHGDESPAHLSLLWGRAYKAFRGTADGTDFAAFARISPGSPALLIDAHTPNFYGGTGQVADWSAARAVAAQFPIFLAGGLTPENVAGAISHVQPWGVDVASGVESAPGQKDERKMLAFVKAVFSGPEGTLAYSSQVPSEAVP
ncbi:MAG: phosphoribosylanthranilate isomerase [Anaerolineales bacterium]